MTQVFNMGTKLIFFHRCCNSGFGEHPSLCAADQEKQNHNALRRCTIGAVGSRGIVNAVGSKMSDHSHCSR